MLTLREQYTKNIAEQENLGKVRMYYLFCKICVIQAFSTWL